LLSRSEYLVACYYCVVRPVMFKKLSHVQGIVGSSVTMSCDASGTPSPKFEFHKVRDVRAVPQFLYLQDGSENVATDNC